MEIGTIVQWGRFVGEVILVVYNWDDTIAQVLVRWDRLQRVPKLYTGTEAAVYFIVLA